jgi:hypothetical protein
MAIGVTVWLLLAGLAFWASRSATKKITPRSRWTPSAWFKAIILAFPWAFLLTPSFAIGAIAFPAPAGLLLVGWLWQHRTAVPAHLQGPVNATGALACIVFTLSWALLSICALFVLRVTKNA